MKKSASGSLLAVGMLVTGLSPIAAHANSGVTLYGVVSTAVRYTSNLDGRHNDQAALVSGGLAGSHWGLRGSEDLGGGNKAIFKLESGFGPDDGRIAYNGLFAREGWVGLSGDWGNLTFGRQYNALNNVGWAFNPLAQGLGNYWSDPLYIGGDIFFQDYRVSNSVVYQHTLGPVTVQLDYGLGEQPGNASRGTTLGGGVKYQQGALALGVAYDQRQSADGANTLRNYSVGGSYAFGKATTYLGHMGQRESASDARFGMSFVGLGYQLTPALHLSGAYYRYQQSGDVTTKSQVVPIALGSGSADSVALVADYALSRRTSLYLEADVVYARDGAVGRETEYWAGTPVLDDDSTTRVGVMLGMRHQF
ncbi:Outer membrane protein (porin) [Cupriavidus sp. YR651]|uniref:porin n=1 Tax=Cupriavidus sp. YR651 TaxID=1855315 RepID=UPI00088C46C0|nr:porin [Cupriavidus sp. YR651]SDC81868.1 Outer membrane protein (porin) [Cupriavidus sp. YR651]